MVNWDEIPKEVTDLTEWIDSLDIPFSKIEREALPSLKRVLSEDNFVKIFNRKRVEELDRRFQIASSRNSVNSVRDIIKSKNLMREDISKEVEFLLNLSGKIR